MKDCPQQPGAPAIILYREEITDGRDQRHVRVQAAEDPHDGRPGPIEYRDPVHRGLHQDHGHRGPRRPRPRARIASSTARSSRKRSFATARCGLAVKTFALPDVDVGSIIDYRYKVEIRQRRAADRPRALDDIAQRPFGGVRAAGRKRAASRIAKDRRALLLESWESRRTCSRRRPSSRSRTSVPGSTACSAAAAGWPGCPSG